MGATKFLKAEADRLETLRSLLVLDTPKESMFDDLVDLAAQHFKVPVSFVSLVDENRLWMKAAHGSSVAQMDRIGSLCAQAIQQPNGLYVPDLSADDRFKTNALLTGPTNFHFYAGIPIVLDQDACVGVFCILDTEPRQLTDEQLEDLRRLARQATTHLEARRREQWRTEVEALLEEHREQLALSSKMSALGEMAAGVAHEINNPLAAIMMRAGELIEMAESSVLQGSRVRDIALMIESTTLRAAKTVKALRDFARDGRLDQMTPQPVSRIFDEALSLCHERFKNSAVELTVHMSSPDTMIECRAVELVQVLLNLLNNSFSAVSEQSKKWVLLECKGGDESIEISVTDSGPGIPQPLREKIMQPFFTTKETGKGTGLGLSISQRIIESHQGILTLDETSRHTRFIIYLPKGSKVLKSGEKTSPHLNRAV